MSSKENYGIFLKKRQHPSLFDGAELHNNLFLRVYMKFIFIIFSMLFSSAVFAGVDLSSTIERVKLNGDGKLWLKMSSATFDQYCKPGWYGFNLYVPESDKSYPYYYGLITTALANQQTLYIANISVFDGSGSCDLTKTGYGIVIRKAP